MGGFKLQIQDCANLGSDMLAQVQGEIMGKAMQTPELAHMLASFQTNAPQLQVDIDRVKAKTQGVALTDIFETLGDESTGITQSLVRCSYLEIYNDDVQDLLSENVQVGLRVVAFVVERVGLWRG